MVLLLFTRLSTSNTMLIVSDQMLRKANRILDWSTRIGWTYGPTNNLGLFLTEISSYYLSLLLLYLFFFATASLLFVH